MTFRYTGPEDRIRQTQGGQTTTYTLDIAAGLTQVLAEGTNTYWYGVDRIAQEGASGQEYFLGDALGSVRQLVDPEGNVTLAKEYQPYGEGMNSAGVNTADDDPASVTTSRRFENLREVFFVKIGY